MVHALIEYRKSPGKINNLLIYETNTASPTAPTEYDTEKFSKL